MKLIFTLLVAFCVCLAVFCEEFNPEEYVNILGGTESEYGLSHGGTLPLIARPWGFNSWAPYTNPGGGGWWFHPNDRSFYGMRLTHQPSPWIGDYGTLTIKAEVTAPSRTGDSSQYSGYSPTRSTFSPYYFKTTLLAYGTATEDTTLEFSPSMHGGMMKLKFAKYVEDEANSGYQQSRRVAIILNGGSDTSSIVLPSESADTDTLTITGKSTQNNGGVSSNFGHYFVAAIYAGPNGDIPITSITGRSASSSAAVVDLSPLDAANDELTIRVATSFISLEQAWTSLKAEVGTGVSFEDLTAQAKQEWNAVLGRAKLTDVGSGYSSQERSDLLTTFYSSLYRASLFPRQLTETDASGKTVHWSPFDGSGGVYEGALSTDSGFWDAYNTVYPYLSLINPKVLGTMIDGWLSGYKEGGWLPKWASPGYRDSMAGSMGDVSIADAIVKGIPGFDRSVALDAILKDAKEIPTKGVSGIGRGCLESYQKYGYIPKNSPQTNGGSCPEVVSQSLNYMQADYAIAQAALALNRTDDVALFLQRGLNYASIFDNSTFFFRSRSVATQEFVEPFDQFAWGDDYTEGGPWQFKFYVPHDPRGLGALYSSVNQSLCDHLQLAQTQKSTFHIGGYGTEIHEETEMPDGCWGQYAHNNQPVHHMLWMFVASDTSYHGSCASQGQYWLRRATSTLYKPTADMFAGDEDNGEMGAWYILASLGLYSLNPGTQEYVLGSPQFGRVDISLCDKMPCSQDEMLSIVAVNQSAANVYVQSIRWRGVPLPDDSVAVPYSDLMEGGVLEFTMGPTAPTSASKAAVNGGLRGGSRSAH